MQASNATFVGQLRCDDHEVQVVYKPTRGERPLWDFPTHTLAFREVAAYEISRLGDFDVVPVTVLADGPAGQGSLQVWVEEDTDEHHPLVDLVPARKLPREGYFDVVDGLDRYDSTVSVVHADHPLLRIMAVFDALINNADRKGGHIIGSLGRVFGVDHGISFHAEDKLRTILWGWAGTPLTEHRRRPDRDRPGRRDRGVWRRCSPRTRSRRCCCGPKVCWRPASCPTRPVAGRRFPGRPSEPSHPPPSPTFRLAGCRLGDRRPFRASPHRRTDSGPSSGCRTPPAKVCGRPGPPPATPPGCTSAASPLTTPPTWDTPTPI